MRAVDEKQDIKLLWPYMLLLNCVAFQITHTGCTVAMLDYMIYVGSIVQS